MTFATLTSPLQQWRTPSSHVPVHALRNIHSKQSIPLATTFNTGVVWVMSLDNRWLLIYITQFWHRNRQRISVFRRCIRIIDHPDDDKMMITIGLGICEQTIKIVLV